MMPRKIVVGTPGWPVHATHEYFARNYCTHDRQWFELSPLRAPYCSNFSRDSEITIGINNRTPLNLFEISVSSCALDHLQYVFLITVKESRIFQLSCYQRFPELSRIIASSTFLMPREWKIFHPEEGPPGKYIPLKLDFFIGEPHSLSTTDPLFCPWNAFRQRSV